MHMFAVVLISGGFLSMGVIAARNLRCCANELREVIIGVQVIKRELKYSLAPLNELLQMASAQTAGETQLFFDDCKRKIEAADGELFETIWRQALERRKFCLKQADYLILMQLGSVLGRYDADEQIMVLSRTVEQLEQRYLDAKEESRRMGRVYMVLGFSVGMFMLLLFL